MKKFLIMVLLAMGSIANAQKNTYLIDGSIGFNTFKTNDGSGWSNSGSSFNFSPKVGYQFNDKWTVGLQLGVSIGGGESTNDNYTNASTTDISKGFYYGGFLRYNKKISEFFMFFTDFNIGFNNGETTFENLSTTGVKLSNSNSYNGFNANITPAISLDIKNNFRLNISFGGLAYNYSHKENDSGNYSYNNNFGFNFGQTYAFGVSKNF